MSRKYITASLYHMSSVPDGAIYRGNGMFDFDIRSDEDYPHCVFEILAEYDKSNKTYFKNKKLKIKVRADEIRDKDKKGGKPI